MRALCLSMGIVLLGSSLSVSAGGINSEEQRLINEASGRFTYEGKIYKAKDTYLDLLKAKLSEDDMDLSAEQVDQYLATMYASVANGLEQGILEEVTDGSSGTKTEDPSVTALDDSGNAGTQKTADTEVPTETKDTGDVPETVKAPKSKEEPSVSKKVETESETDSGKETETETKKETETESESITETEETERESKASLKVKDSIEKTKETKSNDKGEVLKGVFLVILTLLAAGAVSWIAIMLRKRKQQKDFGKLAAETEKLTDLHCHILPGVDDGSRDMDMTLKMLDMAYGQGVRRIIATPHYHIGYVQNEPEKLQDVLEKVRAQIRKRYPDLEIRLGNEVYYSDGVIELLKEGKILTLGEGSRYVLVEFSLHDTYSRIQEAVTKLMRAGYWPVIAHVERYQCMHRQKAHFEELQEQGVLFQVNFNSIGKNKWLFRHGFVDLLSTDCHNEEERTPKIQVNMKDLNTCCNREQIERILRENPDMVWNSGKDKER